MLERRTSFWLCLLGAGAVLLASTGPLTAQDAPNANEPAVEKTPWPPKDAANLAQHEIKRVPEQQKGLLLYTPNSWTKQAFENKNDGLVQFTIPAGSGQKDPARLEVLCFESKNKISGGGVQANIEGWADEFQGQPEKKVLTGDGPQGKYVLVDLNGTYKGPEGKTLENARMLAVIIGIRWQEKTKDNETQPMAAVYFLKAVGPAETIDANEEALRKAFGAAATENELKENTATTPTAGQ